MDELDGVLGTSRWKVKAGESEDPFEALDRKLGEMKGRKALKASHLQNGLGETGKAKQILVGAQRGAMGLDF